MKTKEEIEQLAESQYGTEIGSIRGSNPYDLEADRKNGYVKGYTQCQEDMTDKKLHRQEHSKTWDESMRNLDVRGGNIVRAWDDFDEYYEQFKKD